VKSLELTGFGRGKTAFADWCKVSFVARSQKISSKIFNMNFLKGVLLRAVSLPQLATI